MYTLCYVIVICLVFSFCCWPPASCSCPGRSRCRACRGPGSRQRPTIYYTMIYCTILYYTVLYYTILSSTLLYSSLLYYRPSSDCPPPGRSPAPPSPRSGRPRTHRCPSCPMRSELNPKKEACKISLCRFLTSLEQCKICQHFRNM